MIEEARIHRINKKLTRRRVRIIGSCHRNGSTEIFEAVCSFVFDRFECILFFHAWFESASLDHEPRNYAVEDSAVIEARFCVFDKIQGSVWCEFIIELDGDIPKGGVHEDSFHKRNYLEINKV